MTAHVPSDVLAVYKGYPAQAQTLLLHFREWIFILAKHNELGKVTESLKWGQPSYAVSSGSPFRLAWNAKHPDSVSVFFVCTTKLVDTFKQLFGQELQFVGNRELRINMSEELLKTEIQTCFVMALNYQKLKSLPLLGFNPLRGKGKD